MRLQAVQCWFPGATQEQADRVAAGFQCAAEHLDTASVVFVPNSGGGTPAGPPADQRWWDRIAEDTAARGLTVFAFTVTSPGPGELARPIALWYIALLEPWARLPEPEQVRVLAHEGLHFCRFEIGGVSAPLEHHDTEALLNVNRWEGLMDDLNGFPLRAGLPPRSFLCP